jgi:hypothetical protein
MKAARATAAIAACLGRPRDRRRERPIEPGFSGHDQSDKAVSAPRATEVAQRLAGVGHFELAVGTDGGHGAPGWERAATGDRDEIHFVTLYSFLPAADLLLLFRTMTPMQPESSPAVGIRSPFHPDRWIGTRSGRAPARTTSRPGARLGGT